MKYIKYFLRFLLIAGVIVFTLSGTYSSIKNEAEEQTNVVVTDKYTKQYRGTITNYVDVCRKSDNLCTTLFVRNLEDYNVGGSYIFVLSNARFMANGYIFYWAISFAIFTTFLLFLVVYFIAWCFKD